MTANTPDDVHAEVRRYYQEAAANRPAGPSTDTRWGTSCYDDATLADAADDFANFSMGCGNPYALADLRDGEVVLDLGSGGGLDVILSARRVAPNGKAYGVDFLDEMIELATDNAAQAGVHNVEFLKGMIEDVPLPDASVDVVISNCVVNLAPDKRPVWSEVARVLAPGGRVAISDVVAEDGVDPTSDLLEWAECGAGALQRSDYEALMTNVGLSDVSIEFTHETGPGLQAAIVRATKPA